MRLVVVVVALCLLALPLSAQDYVAPRGPDGENPDISGIWQALNEANYDLELHMARSSMQEREGPHGTIQAVKALWMGAVGSVPPGLGVIKGGGKIPYTAAGLEKRMENQKNWLDLDPEVKCYLPGVPRANYMGQPFQIFQGDNSVFFAYQYAGAVRDVIMGDDPGRAPVDSWMGQSWGRWEGDTLVIEATSLLDSTWLDRSGNHHSDQLVVTERYTPMSPNHLLYEATLEDPGVLTEPFTISMPLYRRMEENAQLMDFRCVEFVEEMLYGEWRRHPLPR